MNLLLNRGIRWIAVLASSLLLADVSSAVVFDFEPPAYIGDDTKGAPLNGQVGWYNPVPPPDISFYVFTYAGNTPGFPANPTGGLQFAGGTSLGDVLLARSQHDKVNSPGPCWSYAYDFAAKFRGSPPAVDNIGSFSKNPAPNDYIHLLSWVPGMEGVRYNAWYLAHDAGGTQFPQPGGSPGPAWDGLEVNHWYRATTIVDYATNTITEVKIKDLVTGVETVSNPIGWYLEGGAAGSTADATALRIFAGGATAGNTMAFDNIEQTPCSATAVEPTTWGRIKNTFTDSQRGAGSRTTSEPIYWPAVY
jgi:hypothetical protein